MSLIPLTVLYSSFTKYFLLFLLTIWRPSVSKPDGAPYQFQGSHYENPLIIRALEIWDEDKLDREWVVRNVLGGMAAGFGLRGNVYSGFTPPLASQRVHSGTGLPPNFYDDCYTSWLAR